MDAKKFGSFLATLRKERGLTQAELAGKLQITDKAVSRWERGIGLPDISVLEPLSAALQITVLELLKSEKFNHKELSHEEVSNAVIETIEMATEQQKTFKRNLLVVFTGVVCIISLPVIALLVGYTNFPFQPFLLFFIPLCLLCAGEYVLCMKNRVIAFILPILVFFSSFAFGKYALIIASALFTEYFVVRHMNTPQKNVQKEEGEPL